ncbi:MAG: hypothetical protein ACE5EQ_08305, partial [Phycisphaerae bacterium]
MAFAKNTVWACTACFVALSASAGAASAQIPWRTGPADRSGKSRAEVIDTIMTAGRRAGGGHITLQFDEPITPARRAALAEAGVTLHGYLGDNAFFAAVASGGGNKA